MGRYSHLGLRLARVRKIVKVGLEPRQLAPPSAEEPGWVQLFNGKDLAGLGRGRSAVP
jgi:hypothetical protein